MNLIFDDYYYSFIKANAFFELFREHVADVYEDTVEVKVHQMLSEREIAKLNELNANLDANYQLYLKISKGEKTIGWMYGRQSDGESFNMMNSAILKEYRNQGIYTKVLKDVLDRLENVGFQKVESQHQASNNSVIIPKLKAGFIITGIEIDDKVGMRVRLTYTFNKKRRDALAFRIGSKKLNKSFKKYLSLWES